MAWVGIPTTHGGLGTWVAARAVAYSCMRELGIHGQIGMYGQWLVYTPLYLCSSVYVQLAGVLFYGGELDSAVK